MTITGTVLQPPSSAISNCRVDITVSDGILVAPTTGHVDTDQDGRFTPAVRRDTAGYLTLTARVSNPCGAGEIAETISVWFDNPSATDDWPMFQHDIAHTGVSNVSLPANLVEKWRLELAGDSNGILWSSPVVMDGWVYVGTNNAQGTLYAVRTNGMDARTRNLGSAIEGSASVSGGRVYIGTVNGTLHSVYAGDQQGHNVLDPDWTKTFPDESITGGVTVYNGAAYVGTAYSGNGRLHTLNLADQAERSGSPAPTPYAVDYTTPGIDELFSGGARGYISDSSCAVTAIRCDTGAQAWSPPGYWMPDSSSFYSSPTIYAGYILGGSSWGYVYRIVDAGSNYSLPSPVKYYTSGAVNSTLAALSGKLYFGSLGGNFYCLNAAALTQVWSTGLGSPITCSALISQPSGVIFVCTDGGILHARSLTNGSYLWSYDFSTGISDPTTKASLAAADGKLFVVVGSNTNAGRRLYCFGP